jgi:hypothetical protein
LGLTGGKRLNWRQKAFGKIPDGVPLKLKKCPAPHLRMNIYRLSIFFTPVSFRWTIPLRDFKTQPPKMSRYGPWDEESKMVKSATLVNFLVAQKEVSCFCFFKKSIKANVNRNLLNDKLLKFGMFAKFVR